MASHVWGRGLLALCGVDASLAAANWKTIASGNYAAYWHCELETTQGDYTTKVYVSEATESTVGTGYSTMGVAIDGASHNQLLTSLQNTQKNVEFYSNQTDSMPQWTTCTTTASFATVFPSTGVRTTCPVLANFDLGGSKSVTSGTFTLTFGTDNTQTGSVFNLAIQ